MKMTIKKIAEMAGVTNPVVSAVINNSTKNRVSAAKREKILQLIKKHHFVPNATAQNLVKGKTQVINFIIPSSAFFTTPESYKFVMGFQEAIKSEGYRLHFTSLSYGYQEYRSLDRITADGNIMFYWGVPHNKVVRAIQKLGLPLLVAYGKCLLSNTHNIYFDNKTAMYNMTKTVLAAGHRNILYAECYGGDIYFQEGERGIRQAVKEAGPVRFEKMILPRSLDDIMHEDEQLFSFGQRAAAEIMAKAKKPDVVMFNRDVVACGAIREFKRQGWRVPEDISVTGNGNHQLGGFWEPALTTVEDKSIEAGKRAGEMMVALIQNKVKKTVREKMAMDVIWRSSLSKK